MTFIRATGILKDTLIFYKMVGDHVGVAQTDVMYLLLIVSGFG